MNRRGAAMGVVFGLPLTLAIAATAASGCNSSKSQAVGLGDGCALNSDCNSPLVCVFSLCHAQCAQSRDCPPGQKCVSSGTVDVCQLPAESTCSATQACKGGLVCASDQCANACNTSTPCQVTGQTCQSGACYDPSVGPDGGDGGVTSDGSTPVDGTSPEADAPFVPNPDAGVLGFTPSNFNPAGVDAGDAGASWTGAPAADITATCANCLPVTPTTITMNDGTLADVYVLKSLLIAQTAALRLTGPNPAILAVLTTVDIQGQLLVNGTDTIGPSPGPGGFVGGASPGPGVGQLPGGAGDPNSNGGGASYCGVGGTAGATSGTAALGGATYGTPAIVPLVGGSAGGEVGAQSAGGGALQIVAGQSIIIRSFGAINAGGGGTINENGTGGGASGGAILLESPTVTVDGNLGANGGGGMAEFQPGADATANATPAAGAAPWGGAGSAGTTINGAAGTAGTSNGQTGGGGGGAGRIRINTSTGSATITGIISPAMTTPCATQGTLN